MYKYLAFIHVCVNKLEMVKLPIFLSHQSAHTKLVLYLAPSTCSYRGINNFANIPAKPQQEAESWLVTAHEGGAIYAFMLASKRPVCSSVEELEAYGSSWPPWIV